MSIHPKVTVLMPVYNGRRFLGEAIESILNQTFQDFEFLIVNDASTDSSRDIVLSYDDPRIRLVDNEENIGLTRSLNKGLRLARGEYIARMDADDVSLPQRLERQVQCIEEKPRVELVASWYDVIDEKGDLLKTVKFDYDYEDIYYNLIFNNCLAHLSVLFNRELVLELGGYNEQFKRAQDYELWCRISRVARIEQIKEALVQWRNVKSNISYEFREEQDRYAKEVFKANMENLLSRKIEADEGDMLCLHSHDYISEAKDEDIKRAITALHGINKKIIETVVTSKLDIDIQKLERSSLEKISTYIMHLIKRGRFLAAVTSMSAAPNKKELITFLSHKLRNRLSRELGIKRSKIPLTPEKSHP